MSPRSFHNGKVQLHAGDCMEVLRSMPDDCIDAVVTDPPYHLTSIVKRFSKNGYAKSNLEQPADKNLDGIMAGSFRRLAKGFMGKQWDGGDIAFRPELWAEVLRVLKPGGHMVAFSGTRTYHRMAVAIEDAGFEIRDQLAWVYGSGFPKSHDVSKGIDKNAPRVGQFIHFAAHYAERRKACGLTHAAICEAGKFYDNHNHGGASVNWEHGHNVPTLAQWNVLKALLGLDNEFLPLIERVETEREITGEAIEWKDRTNYTITSKDGFRRDNPATDSARQWQGWGTALKPSWEPICLARKPLSEGTVAANVLRWGTGALNIDATRIGGQWEQEPSLCSSCVARAESTTKLSTRGIRESTATNPAGQTMNGKEGSFPADTSSLDIGCFDGTRAEDTFTNSSTLEFGRMQTGQSQTASKSTTEMKTKETTQSTICSSCQKPIIGAGISPNGKNGRWPANLVHDGSPEVMEGFPESASGVHSRRAENGNSTSYGFATEQNTRFGGDSGSAARFFATFPQEEPAKRFHYTSKADADDRLGSRHPTVKPVDLMQWLVRLVCPKSGTVLDPFAGTGTTGAASFIEGCRCVLIEREAEYLADIERRMELLLSGPDERARKLAKPEPHESLPLFGAL